MLISLDWIKEFVKLPQEVSDKDIAERLTMAVCEVDSLHASGQFWKQVKVARVTKVEPHPAADKLRLASFVLGEAQERQVVCGAPNVRVGLKTPFAPAGTTLPGGLTLQAKEIRGVLSAGMLCSEQELGLGKDADGIMELPEDAPVGQDLANYLDKQGDTILDIDNKSLTHRPDLWGHYGMAREVAAAFKSPLANPFDKSWEAAIKARIPGGKSPVSVSVDPASAALCYFGLSIDGITVRESPPWLVRRLEAAQLRPINNIVDISNYCLLELGMPNHIFDRDRIAGQRVQVIPMKEEAGFTTLDGMERKILPGDTMICDHQKPLVIAGIMGGQQAAVSSSTKRIFLEVANWQARHIRAVSTRLGLRTDSSARFEKSLDSQLCRRTLYRLVELILQLNGQAKVVGQVEYGGKDLGKWAAPVLPLRTERVNKLLGKEIATEEVISILQRLDFKTKEQKPGVLAVEVPSYRATKDIEGEVDLIEEIGRHIGYGNIAAVCPRLEVRPSRRTPSRTLAKQVRHFLVHRAGAFEVSSYPIVGKKLLRQAALDKGRQLELLHPLSAEHDRMRPSLLPSLLEIAARNGKHFESFRFFEYGRAYLPGKAKDYADERYQLGLVFGSRHHNIFMELLNNTKRLIRATSMPAVIAAAHPKFKNEIIPEDWPGLHPFEFANIRLQGKMKGAVFGLHPLFLRQWKIRGHLAVALFDLSDFHQRHLGKTVAYKPLPKFPESAFDYTITLPAQRSVGDIFEELDNMKIKEVVGHKIVAVYGDNPQELRGERQVTMRTTFRADERTLKGDFLKRTEQTMLDKLARRGILLKAK